MEIINWISEEEKGRWDNPNLVAYSLIEAMSEKAPRGDIKDVFAPFDPKALNVEFKVNGVEVSFVRVMGLIQSAISEIESDCKKACHKEAAKEIIQVLENQYRTWE